MILKYLYFSDLCFKYTKSLVEKKELTALQLDSAITVTVVIFHAKVLSSYHHFICIEQMGFYGGTFLKLYFICTLGIWSLCKDSCSIYACL